MSAYPESSPNEGGYSFENQNDNDHSFEIWAKPGTAQIADQLYFQQELPD